MYRACIAAADTQHCRIYLFDRTSGEAHLDEHFTEIDELASANAEQIGQFARHIMARLRELTDEHGVVEVFVAAGPRMLGQLRAARPGTLGPRVTVTEIARELTKLSPHDLRVELAAQHMLPPVPDRQHAPQHRP